MNNNQGKCGHARCAGGNGCLQQGEYMQAYEKDIIITTQEEARQYAINWQDWASKQSFSIGELADGVSFLEDLAERFDLQDEFEENGLI